MSDSRHPDPHTQGCSRHTKPSRKSTSRRHALESLSRQSPTRSKEPRTYRLLYNQTRGLYRLYARTEKEDVSAPPGYTEIERYATEDELRTTLRHWPNLLRFVVIEHPENEDVTAKRLDALSHDWLGTENKPFILFNNEADAATYAESQRAGLRPDGPDDPGRQDAPHPL